MSYGARPTNYLEADVMSRSPEWLVPLLYEHLLASLKRSDVHLEVGDLEGKATSLMKANGIVLELAGSLDPEQGGPLAGNLASLYSFFAGEILEIGRTLDRPRLARLIAMVADLHEAWVQAAEQVAPRGGQRAATLAASA